ncbi:PorP/SprF family type IX secretion system membrane protein [Larkinella terrae]|uniref:Type IX secretion system membrane protein PorP/SprF n=1 Tax=Larkinella terrae TaxID=2025311 RepID=A0A7K0EU16_9BACT|nr:PorP/SprF family type IX secretion system membrane protein [Larkinella terrae]MRS65001.1 type IX secretion system membrane protein PorP/SprF [Larkinella terrae]
MIRRLVWKTALGIVLLFAGSQTVWAQREVLYSQYLINPLTINPAYTGARESLTMTAIFRRKWFGLQGAGFPITQSFGADGALAGGKVGIGLQALNDRMGLYSATGFYGSLAYLITLPSMAKLSFGGSGGINVLPIYDPTSSTSINRAIPSVGVGVYYEADRFWAGISMPELVTRPISLAAGQAAPLRYQRPLYINFGGRFSAGESIDFMPSILLTHQTGLPLGIDLNAKLWIEQKLGLTLSYRANNATLISTQNYFVAMAEYELSKSIRVGYSLSSRQVENPFYPQKSVHEIIFRFTPNPIKFRYQ